MLLFGPALRGWLRLLPWLLLLGGLASSGWWRYYLAPRHVPYLWAGLFALVFVLLASELDALLARREKRLAALAAGQAPPTFKPARPADWLEFGVHWLPLLLLGLLGHTTLTLNDHQATDRQLLSMTRGQDRHQPVAETRAAQLGRRQNYVVPPKPPVVSRPQPVPAKPQKLDPAIQGTRIVVTKVDPTSKVKLTAKTQPALAPPRSVASITKQPAKPPPAKPPMAAPALDYRETDMVKLFTKHGGNGDHIAVIGKLHRVKGNDEIVPEGINPHKVDVVLYRFAVWCCVADAIPATAILTDIDKSKVHSESWVRLTGRLEHTGPEHDIPLIKVDKIEEIATPDDPYLYIDPDELKSGR